MQIFGDYAQFYNLIYQRSKDYRLEADMVYRWAGNPESIVDLGCGTGLHHKYWKCVVFGIDRAAKMLALTKPNNHRIYARADIEKDIILHKHYCYTALFNVIGYCNLESIISQMQQPAGGIFIFDIWDKAKVDKEPFNTIVKKFKWGKVSITPYHSNLHKPVLNIRVEPVGGKAFTELHCVSPYSTAAIKALCHKYGYFYLCKETNNWTTWYKLIKL